MSELLFIRHAETDMAGTFCGHSDPELNRRGEMQVSELVKKLRMEQIGAVYTSDLRRAQATGRAVASSFGVECYVRPALREIYFGQWEGLLWAEIELQDRAYAQRWVAEYPDLPAPGGELFTKFEQRVLDEIELLVMQAAGRCAAVVTHAGVMRTVLCRLCGCSETEALQQTRTYCSVVRYAAPAFPVSQAIEVRP